MSLATRSSRRLLPAEQDSAYLVVQVAVRCEDRRAVDAPAAIEIGHAAAGLLDEQRGRRSVPRLELDLQHRLRRALGNERVAPEVAESAIAPGGLEQRTKAGRTPGSLEISRARVQDLGVREVGDARGADASRLASRTARGPRATAAPGVPALAQRGRGADRGLQLAVALGGDERREDRDATDVVMRAIDRVDIPAGGRVPASVPYSSPTTP